MMSKPIQSKKLLGTLVAALWLTFSSPSVAQLPPKVEADLLQRQIVEAVDAGNYSLASQKISRYKQLGIPVPPTVLLLDAKIAVSLDKPLVAKKALEAYFNASGREHSGYQEALDLYQLVLPEANKIQAELDVERRAEERKRAEEEKKERDFRALLASLERTPSYTNRHGTHRYRNFRRESDWSYCQIEFDVITSGSRWGNSSETEDISIRGTFSSQRVNSAGNRANGNREHFLAGDYTSTSIKGTQPQIKRMADLLNKHYRDHCRD